MLLDFGLEKYFVKKSVLYGTRQTSYVCVHTTHHIDEANIAVDKATVISGQRR